MHVLIIVEFDSDTDIDIKIHILFSIRIKEMPANIFVSNVPLIARSPAPVRAANLCDALMSPAADSLRYASTPAVRTTRTLFISS
jgi:hypothetical protein